MNDCAWPWYSAVFGYGDFTFCCFSDPYSMGKIGEYNGSVDSVWNHETIQGVRQSIVDKRIREVCPSTCPHLISGPATSLWNIDRRIIKNIARIEDEAQRLRAEENYVKAKESFIAGETRVSHSPVWMLINCGTGCNLKCKFCYQIRVPYRVPDDKGIQFIDQCADQLSFVHLTGGEPLVTKFGRRLLEAFGTGKYQFVVDLGTNAQFTDFKLLRPVRLGRIQISTDGATKETYEKVRVRGDFEDLISNIRQFVDLSKEKPGMEVTTNYTVCSDNYHEIPQAVALYEGLGLECWFHLVLYEPGDPLNLRERFDLHEDLLDKVDQGIAISNSKQTKEKLREIRNTIEQLNASRTSDLLAPGAKPQIVQFVSRPDADKREGTFEPKAAESKDLFSGQIESARSASSEGRIDIPSAIDTSDFLIRTRQLEKAFTVLADALEQNPGSEELLLQLGRLAILGNMLDVAQDFLTEAAKTDLGLQLIREYSIQLKRDGADDDSAFVQSIANSTQARAIHQASPAA